MVVGHGACMQTLLTLHGVPVKLTYVLFILYAEEIEITIVYITLKKSY